MSRPRGNDLRAQAAVTLQQVLGAGRSLRDSLPAATPGESGQPRLRAICYGVLRLLPLLRRHLAHLLKVPLKPRDGDLEGLLLAAIYELGWMRTAEHAVINESVTAARALGKPRAAGLVNGVLRSYQRAGKPTDMGGLSDEELWLHPQWLIDELRRAWPQDYPQILTANNHQGPLWLRVNTRRKAVADYVEELAAADLAAMPSAWAPAALKLEQPVGVERLPGFADGAVSVQDLAAQLAPALLGARPGDRVLDACAAPGSKAAHLLESTPGIELTALDVNPQRCQRTRESLARLGLKARVVVADAAGSDWWDGRPFERILLDAPCSATGVIRRHPDIKWLRRASDIGELAALQGRLLEALWTVLAPGGRLLYATCSALPAENQRRVEGFVSDHEDATEVPIEAPWGRAMNPGRQILPGEGDADGFFYALLQKR